MGEKRLQDEIRAAVIKTDKAILWRNTVGFDMERKIRYGLGLGSPDLVGFLIGSGRFLGGEVKTEQGRLSEAQTRWIESARERGALIGTWRSVPEALEFIHRYAGPTP